jgi:hypothetical protein
MKWSYGEGKNDAQALQPFMNGGFIKEYLLRTGIHALNRNKYFQMED